MVASLAPEKKKKKPGTEPKQKKTHSEHSERASVAQNFHRGARAPPHLVELLVQVDPERLERELRGVHGLVLLALGRRHERREGFRRARQSRALASHNHRVRHAPRRARVGGLAVFKNDAHQLVAVDRL